MATYSSGAEASSSAATAAALTPRCSFTLASTSAARSAWSLGYAFAFSRPSPLPPPSPASPQAQAHRAVELARPPAARRLGVAEHDPDFLAQLVDEDHSGARPVDRPRELTQRLAHQAGLEAGEGIAHVALDLRPRHECRDRAHHDHA